MNQITLASLLLAVLLLGLSDVLLRVASQKRAGFYAKHRNLDSLRKFSHKEPALSLHRWEHIGVLCVNVRNVSLILSCPWTVYLCACHIFGFNPVTIAFSVFFFGVGVLVSVLTFTGILFWISCRRLSKLCPILQLGPDAFQNLSCSLQEKTIPEFPSQSMSISRWKRLRYYCLCLAKVEASSLVLWILYFAAQISS